MSLRRFGWGALAIVGVLCSVNIFGHWSVPVAARGPSYGHPASPLVQALPFLKGARLPLYLPSKLPSPPAGAFYAIEAHTHGAGYDVSVSFSNQQAPVNDPAVSSRAGFVGEVVGGPKQSVGADVRHLIDFTGSPQSVTLPNGTKADFYPQQGIAWTEGGWHYAILDRPAKPATADSLLPAVAKIQEALLPAGNPIGAGTTGEVVEPIGADAPSVYVLWITGNDAYEITGLVAPPIILAKDLVQVRPNGGG